MILGTGIDLVDNRRIQRTISRFDKRFKNRCFSNNEINKSKKISNKINFFSKRYAAKEACAKALGKGFNRGIFWKDIEIDNDRLGKPIIILHNKAKILLSEMSNGKCDIFLSLSDEKNYSIANVVIYENNARGSIL